jgi:hypothetical protein
VIFKLVELDNFDGAIIGSLLDFVGMGVKIDTLLDFASIVGDVENFGAGIFAEIADRAALFDPDFFDSHLVNLLNDFRKPKVWSVLHGNHFSISAHIIQRRVSGHKEGGWKWRYPPVISSPPPRR